MGRFGYRRQAAAASRVEPGRRGTAERVVALIDQRPCSVAAVRQAVALAGRRAVPVEILFVQSHPSALLAMNSLGVLAVGPVMVLEDELERELFGTVAAIIAPSSLPWTFGALPHHLAAAVVRDEAMVTLVVARHSRRLRRGRLLATARTVEARSGGTARLLIVRCDHHPEPIYTPAPVRS